MVRENRAAVSTHKLGEWMEIKKYQFLAAPSSDWLLPNKIKKSQVLTDFAQVRFTVHVHASTLAEFCRRACGNYRNKVFQQSF